MGSNDPNSNRYAEVLSKIYALILSWNDQEHNCSEKGVRVAETQVTLMEDLVPSSDEYGREFSYPSSNRNNSNKK